jgi:hypothetical protein
MVCGGGSTKNTISASQTLLCSLARSHKNRQGSRAQQGRDTAKEGEGRPVEVDQGTIGRHEINNLIDSTVFTREKTQDIAVIKGRDVKNGKEDGGEGRRMWRWIKARSGGTNECKSVN